MTELGGDASASEVVLDVLDTLLLVFIVVELLFAVRVILGGARSSRSRSWSSG